MTRALLLLVLLGVPLRAAAQPDTTVVLPGVTVTAARGAVPVAEAPARVTVLGAGALETPSTHSVADLLEARTGAFVRRYGGGLATLALRGTGAAQTLVLIDGHRLADPQLGQLDLSLLPALLLESVEVMGGAGGALYGTDALGGVVNLRTRRPGEGPRLTLRAGAGAYGERTGSVLAAGTRGRLSGLAAAALETTEGDYPYRNRALFPPTDVPRRGADRTQNTFFGTVGYDAPRTRLRTAAWYANAERGLPTLYATASRGERQWDEHLRLWADAERRLRRGSLRLGGLVQRTALRYRNEQLGLDETGRTTLASLDAEVRLAPGRRWLAGAGLAAGLGRAAHPSLAADARQGHVGAFVHGTGHYGRLLVYPALRADVYVPSGAPRMQSVNPRLGLNLRLAPGLHAKASAGRAFRVPTFNDRFWQPGGNPRLRPEHGWTLDGGLLWAHRTGRAEVTAFASRIRDQIVWRPVQQGVWSPENVQRVRSRGIEASYEAGWRATGRLRLGGGAFYTLTDARDRSDPAAPSFGQPVRHVPRHQMKVHLEAGAGAVQIGLAGRYAGRRYVTADATDFLDPFAVIDAHVRLRHAAGPVAGALALAVENLLDRRYAVLPAQPMPPRHGRLQLTLTFR
ncbi:MAG: TonB-dependent receptor [Rhodothermales bacterium]|nr:TonB-dependent receptor [Rhodothermales bacterium]